jgi:hypothetical protein
MRNILHPLSFTSHAGVPIERLFYEVYNLVSYLLFKSIISECALTVSSNFIAIFLLIRIITYLFCNSSSNPFLRQSEHKNKIPSESHQLHFQKPVCEGHSFWMSFSSSVPAANERRALMKE